MIPEAFAIIDVFRTRNLGAGSFIDFTDFGEALVWEAGSIRDEQTRAALRYLIDNGYVNEMIAGLQLSNKGAEYSRTAAKKGASTPQYWVVGAMWGGQEDQAPKFIRRGYWFLGWSDEDAPEQAHRRDKIRAGDLIAIKRMMGKASSQIRITTLGIVTEIDEEDQCVYVNWVATDLDRQVESRGCFASIHGPFDAEDPWTKEVFLL